MPKYHERPAAFFPRLVVSYYQRRGGFTLVDFQRYVNSFGAERCEQDLECLGWHGITTGDALIELGQLNEALQRLSNVASSDAFDNHFRFQSVRLIAFLHWRSGKKEEAHAEWQRALKYANSRAILENLAIYHQERSEFEAGDAYFSRAMEALTQSRRDPTCGAISTLEEQATFHVNRANFYRFWALHDRPRFAALRLKAYEEIDAAERVDPNYMDLYWTGAHIAMAVADPGTALRRLEEARAVLKRGDVDLEERYRKFRYREVGVPYTSWIELRAHFVSGRPIPSERVLAMRSDIPGFSAQPYEAVTRLLQRLESTGYQVNDDRRDLKSMRGKNYLAPFSRR